MKRLLVLLVMLIGWAHLGLAAAWPQQGNEPVELRRQAPGCKPAQPQPQQGPVLHNQHKSSGWMTDVAPAEIEEEETDRDGMMIPPIGSLGPMWILPLQKPLSNHCPPPAPQKPVYQNNPLYLRWGQMRL